MANQSTFNELALMCRGKLGTRKKKLPHVQTPTCEKPLKSKLKDSVDASCCHSPSVGRSEGRVDMLSLSISSGGRFDSLKKSNHGEHKKYSKTQMKVY